MNQGEIVIYQAIDNTNFQLAIKVENDLYFYVMKALPDISKRTFWDVDISEREMMKGIRKDLIGLSEKREIKKVKYKYFKK